MVFKIKPWAEPISAGKLGRPLDNIPDAPTFDDYHGQLRSGELLFVGLRRTAEAPQQIVHATDAAEFDRICGLHRAGQYTQINFYATPASVLAE